MSLIITLSFLLWFSLTTTKPLSLASASDNNQVIDFNGNPVIPEREYYIMSTVLGEDEGTGGVRPQRPGDSSSCSYSIIQESYQGGDSVPIKLRIPGKTTGMISAGSTDLEIEFVEKPDCAESSKWGVAFAYGSSSPRLVIGGPEDHPDSTLVSGFFRLEEISEITYKLVFCPVNIFRGSNSCYDIGIENQNGYRQLVLKESKYGFLVVFVKVVSGEGKSMI